MKRTLILLVSILLLISCKKDKDTQKNEGLNTVDNTERTAKQNDGLTLLKGQFVYFKDAAVLQTHAEIYGVFVTDKMLELNKMAEKYKNQPTDMVPVEIRGKITNKKDDKILWENKVEIIEILNVTQPKQEDNNVIKLGQ